MKRCSRCRIEKPPEEFYKNRSRPDGLTVWCSRCYRDNYNRWVAANRERRKGWFLKARHGLTLEEFVYCRDVIQRGLCFICQRPFPSLKETHVDHDAATGIKRGILCGSCNRAIGLLGHDTERLERAAGYLRAFEEYRDARSAS